MKKIKKIIGFGLGAIIAPVIVIKVVLSYFRFQVWIGSFMFDMSRWDSEDILMYGLLSLLISGIFIAMLVEIIYPGIFTEEKK